MILAFGACQGRNTTAEGVVDIGGPVAFADVSDSQPDIRIASDTSTRQTPDTTEVSDPGVAVDISGPDANTDCTQAGTACNDGDQCTVNDQCLSGTCQGTPVDCNDLVPCTNDQCIQGVCDNSIVAGFCIVNGICYTEGTPNPQNACQTCQSQANAKGWTSATACDDGNPCTANDSCTPNGGCAGTPIVCPDDGNPCTIEACTNGSCSSTQSPGPCEDGNPCTVGDTCVNQVCQPGSSAKDADNDGAIDKACGGTDCNDGLNTVAPGKPELCTDGLDNDCNGDTDQADDACNQPVECVDQAACNALNQVCGYWGTQNKNLCSKTCAGIADCDTGQTCTKMPGSASIGYCQDFVGTLPIGEACTQDQQCATNLCEFGFCLQPCLDQSACTFAGDSCTPVGNLTTGPLRSACLADGALLPTGQPCTNAQGNMDSSVCGSGHCDLLSAFPSCAPLCTSEADCLPAQECNLVLYATGTNPNTLPVVQGTFQANTHDAVMGCYTAPNPGFKAVGETCANNEQCTSNKCLPILPGDPTAYCTSFCTSDIECPTGTSCVIEVISLSDTWLLSPAIDTQPALLSAYTITRVCKPG
ncbi:MAG: putative metal-binding motif-containing protein [Myxococcota bacterium]|nr:putative metal-binding motif-containing protein [Myxococcota bacterium]